VIARLPATVTATITPATSYDFTVHETKLSFFDKSTERRTAPQPI
jgi:hypothetical protein